MIPIWLQLGGSLIAVALLLVLCAQLKLGDDVRLADDDSAKALAGAALFGFAAQDVAMDRAGIGALLRDDQGRVMLLRRHGARFAARLLDSHAGIRLDRNFLTIAMPELQFGSVTLDLGPQAQIWAASLRRLSNG